MTKCGQCSKQAIAKVRVGDMEVRHLCGRHFQLHKNKDDTNEVTYVRASDL